MKSILYRNRLLLVLLFLSLCINIFSRYPAAVEQLYTYGFYPVIAKGLRILFGWIPFSIGDIFYFVAGGYLVMTLVSWILYFKKKGFHRSTLLSKGKKLVITFLFVYILFNLLWGINYNRIGIAGQLQLKVTPYTILQLDTLATVLQERLNEYAGKVDTTTRYQLNSNSILFRQAVKVYRQAATSYPFLTYHYPSIKPTLYSYIGQYIGFTGYYNPFTGEAQLKTSVPSFLKPFIVTHEIAHQLGYGKENEANFVAFLSCRAAHDIHFRYSVYFELFWYAIGDMSRKQAKLDMVGKLRLHPQVLKDYDTLMQYMTSTENGMEPYMSRFYDQYLKLNNQPKGTQTYNEVIAWLIAYQKKFGRESI